MSYPCFISYIHPNNVWVRKATERAISAICNGLSFYTRDAPFIDDQRLLPGYNHHERIAEAICQSACMVVLYYPAYLESSYCRQELVAMKRVEQLRKRAMGLDLWGHSLFVPFVIRGSAKELPAFVHQNSLWCDYSKEALAARDLSADEKVKEKILPLAKSIAELHRKVTLWQRTSGIDCRQAQLPTEDETDREAQTSEPAPMPFPGRG